MLIGHVSDEYYAALADVAVELRGPGGVHLVVRSWPSGAIQADVPPGDYEVCFAKPGYGSKRVRARISSEYPASFRSAFRSAARLRLAEVVPCR